MKKDRCSFLIVALLLSGPAVGAAVGQTDLSRFSLSRGVPADSFLAVCARTNPERKFLDDYWAEVTQAFMESGILTDVWDLITDTISDEEIGQVEELASQFGELCKAVQWGKLFEHEFTLALRFRTGPNHMFTETLMIGRSEPKTAQANYEGLKQILTAITELIRAHGYEEKVELTESNEGGVSRITLGATEMPGVGVTIAVWKDTTVIGLVGTSIADDCLALLKGTAKSKGLADTVRFKGAFAQLPPAEDTLVFFDLDGMMVTLRKFIEMIGDHTAKPHEKVTPVVDKGEKAPEKSSPAKLIFTLLNDLSIVDYIACVERTEGHRVFSDTVTVLSEGAKSSPLLGAITSGGSLEDFSRFIPKEAESFWVSAGFDLSKLYHYFLDFVRANAPDGKRKIAEFEAMQKEQWELDIDRDILRLIDGTMAFVSMDKGSILLLKVTDEKKVEAQLDRLFESINGFLGQDNALMLSSVEVADGIKLRQVSHPMMMMMGGMSPPVLGCAKGHFIIGSSAKVVKTCLETAAGKHPNITQSRRWRAEAISPKGKVTSISFTDESNLAEELQGLVAGVSMGLGMAGIMAAQMPPEVQKVFNTIPPLLAKLGPVVGKMDFYQSSAAYETFDSKRWYTREVQNYKDPAQRKAESDDQANSDRP